MIISGGYFTFKENRYVIGAVLSIQEKNYIATASHIFQKERTGCCVLVGGTRGIVREFVDGFDVALIELPENCDTEVTQLGRAEVMGDARLVNEAHGVPCRVIRAGTSLLYLQFPCQDMPQPGDSGSPIQQHGKVIGLLSSVMLGNCTGTAVSSDVLCDLGRVWL